MDKKVLIVVTNTARFGKLDRATGLWLSEASHFNNVMDDNGIEVDYVSPAGGYVPIDPNSLQGTTFDEGCWRYYGDASMRNDVYARSMGPKDIDADDYDCIYYAGGHGAIWDFPEDERLAEIARSISDNDGVIAAVCHGVVGLLPIKDDDGTAFIKGRKVTGFSDAEEKLNGLLDKVPYSTEQALKKAGAVYSCGDPYTDHVVIDGNLITGQNPQSAHNVGVAVVEYLKRL